MAPRPMTPVVCYKEGVRLGIRPMHEWAELLDVTYETLRLAKKYRRPVYKQYTFVDATPEEKRRYRETKSLSVVARAAREQGKSYGQLAAERYAEDIRVSREMRGSLARTGTE